MLNSTIKLFYSKIQFMMVALIAERLGVQMIVDGPFVSKRLGQSIHIRNIKEKKCSYSCIYCQNEKTGRKTIKRKSFFKSEDIFSELQSLLIKMRTGSNTMDYLTFIQSGEPTLDISLGESIDLLRLLGPEIAVTTNSSLLGDVNVREDLTKADYVSLKIDTVNESDWQMINHPEKQLDFASILRGVLEFSESYSGYLVTETKLIKDINTDEKKVLEISKFIKNLKPQMAYLSIPDNPVMGGYVVQPDKKNLNRCYEVFNQQLDQVECLIMDPETSSG